MTDTAAILPFATRAELDRRAAAQEDARWTAEADQAHHMAQASIAALTAVQPSHDAQGAALRSALHAILSRMAERDDFTDRADALAQVEEVLATLLPGPWVVAQ